MTTFHVGFWGSGEVTSENATELLDNQLLPADPDTEFAVYLPESVKRTQQGLRAVQSALKAFQLEYEQVSAEVMLQRLYDGANGNEEAYLVLLWDGEEEETAALAEKAISGGLRVKDLCAALDDVEIAEPEPPPAPKPRGRRREPAEATEPEPIEAIVEGPAILTTPGTTELQTIGEVLEFAIRSIVHEEMTALGLTIGHNTRLELPDTEQQQASVTVRVFVDGDGKYELAGDRQRAPRGKKSAEITMAQAQELGLT